MKIRHLPITDLARIAVQPKDMQRHMLRQVSSGGMGPNYNPTRASFGDITNRQPGVFVSTRAPWPIVRAKLMAACRSGDEQKMNLPVAKQLYDFCVEHGVNAQELDAFPISFSVGPKLICWSAALFIYHDRITIPFTDLRRSRNLTREARRFVFSLMNEALRVNQPDHAEVEFEVFQFSNDSNRTLRVDREDGRWLFTYEQLEEMVSYTQRLWFQVLEEKSASKRRSGKGDPGELFGGAA